MRHLRTGLLMAAAALSALAPPAPAGPGANAEIGIYQCVAVRGVGGCKFSCHTNGAVRVEVHGPDRVQGSASCRTGQAHCTGTTFCTDIDGLTSPESAGFCDLTEGLYAICSSSP